MRRVTRVLGSGDFRWSRRALCAGALALGAGCNSLDPPKPDSDGSHLVIPYDTRPVFRATRTPPPISGGTLLVTRTGSLAVASDSERDAIVVADIVRGEVLGTIPLQAGDEPGRLVEDDAGLVHVALRRGGAVVTVDPTTRSIIRRDSVCGAPRGLALSSATTLEVACADGKLVTLPVAGGDPTRVVKLDSDLRDVVVSPTGLTISRFKSAELLRLDTGGSVTRRDRLPATFGVHSVIDREQLRNNPDVEMGLPMRDAVDPFQSGTAWKTLAGPGGSTIIVHQRALEAPIELVPPSASGSAYGGAGFSCSGIAQNAVSVVGPDGAVRGVSFSGSPLPVDATLMPDGRTLLVVMAGPADTEAPRPFLEVEDSDFGESHPTASGPVGFEMTTLTQIYLPETPQGPAAPEGTVADDPGCFGAQGMATTAPAVAVAYDPSAPARIVVQTVQPSTLVVMDNAGFLNTINFDDGATLDTGFQLFHRDSGAGLACATCHAEGAEDGHVWDFSTVGKRRTQALHVGLGDTAPFHWDGELRSVGALMSEVFVGRMGGIQESDARLAGLESWLFSIKSPAPLRAADDEAVVRGQALFRSSGCQSCHSGPKLTNNQSAVVGTRSSVPLQVPSLIGVGYRAPFIHDGCAKTLADRFNPACGGGDAHGSTSSLDTAQIGDLVAYLESL